MLKYDKPASLYVSSQAKLVRKRKFSSVFAMPCTELLYWHVAHIHCGGWASCIISTTIIFWLCNVIEFLLFRKHLDSSKLDLLQCSCVKVKEASNWRRKLQQLHEIFLFGGNLKVYSICPTLNCFVINRKWNTVKCWELEYVHKEHFAQ